MAGGKETEPRGGAEAELARLRADLAERDEQNAHLSAQVATLTERVAKLTEQVEKLLEKLNQNSKNSHLPPSSDGPGKDSGEGKAGPRSRSKTKRKRGGQKGHRGKNRLLLPPEAVDTVKDLYPDFCLGCAAALTPKPMPLLAATNRSTSTIINLT